MAVALATLQTWLDEALAAKQKLVTGASVVRVGSPDGSVEFAQGDSDKLDAWIARLMSWISAGGITTTNSTRRPVYFTF